MILRPEILKQELNGSQATLTLRLDPELHYFKGHFPSAGILPGVAQVDWALALGRELLGVQGGFQKLETLKFQQVLQPGEEPILSLDYNAERRTLSFEYRSARGRHSSGKFVLQ